MSKEQKELFAYPPSLEERSHIYTVSEITKDIKAVFEDTFGYVWVEGEISNFRPSSAGHFYFSLKDEDSLLAAAMFSRANRDLKFKIEDGLQVICFGKIEAYGPRSQYQIIVEKIEPKGIGGLQLALEQLKRRLEKEGLFLAERKRPIPYLPSKIGVVTSEHGAAIRDILKVLDRRFKDIHIIINPVRVQGDGSKDEIAQAIKDFNRFNRQAETFEQIDVMIVGRGGGSVEDLWAFNEETVARAIYDSKIPVISAVGHERDWTIADLVADLRAPTPSAAAELVIPLKDELREKIDELQQDLKRSVLDSAIDFEKRLDDLVHRLNLLNPAILIPRYKEKLFSLTRQIFFRTRHFAKLRELEFLKLADTVSTLNPLNILNRGYSVTFKLPANEIIKDSTAIKDGDIIRTKLYKGELVSKVIEVKK